jgi:hypothetical protein
MAGGVLFIDGNSNSMTNASATFEDVVISNTSAGRVRVRQIGAHGRGG